jgi:hypothetical protein
VHLRFSSLVRRVAFRSMLAFVQWRRAAMDRPKGRLGGRDSRARVVLARSEGPGGGSLEQLQFPGSRHSLGAAVGVQLAVEVVYMGLYRAHTHEQLLGDPAVGFARGH